MKNEAIEDYLKNIYEIQFEYGKVATTILAKSMSVTPASATGMIKKLSTMSLVYYEPYQGIQLTSEGRKIALEIVRHHRLIELYLVKAMGLPWDEVHAEAEKLEHVLSEKILDRMDELLDYPTKDPHGHPIPTRDGKVTQLSNTRLADLKSGQSVILTEVDDRNPELLRYLGNMGLFPDVKLNVIDVAPFNGPITIRIGKTEHILGKEAARLIYVTNMNRTVS